MNLPYEWQIGLRYFRAKKQSKLMSFVAMIPSLCIGIGVAALIIVLSVMNGFQKEIRTKMTDNMSHLEISNAQGGLDDWAQVAKVGRTQAHVTGAAPFVEGQALFSYSNTVQGVILRGIAPDQENQVTEVGKHMVEGAITDLKAGEFGVIIGTQLARQLDVRVGDKIAVMTPQGNLTPAGMMPRIKQFTLVGLFNTGSYAFDANVGLIGLKDAQVLFRLQDAVSGVRLKLDDPFLAPVVKTQLQQKVFPEADFYLSDWTDKNQEYFNAVKMEKTMLFLILSIIIFVAACNLISTLFMVIMQKQSDIAILRTLGASRGSIAKIFFVQGSASCFIGAVVGLGLGLLVTYNLPFVLSTARLLTGQSLINGAVYGIDTLPYDIQWLDIVQIVGVSLLLSLTATLYPSYRAAKTQPAEALRYE